MPELKVSQRHLDRERSCVRAHAGPVAPADDQRRLGTGGAGHRAGWRDGAVSRRSRPAPLCRVPDYIEYCRRDSINQALDAFWTLHSPDSPCSAGMARLGVTSDWTEFRSSRS